MVVMHGAGKTALCMHGTLTSLWWSDQGKLRTVELLLQQKASVDVVAKQNMTAVMEAAKGGHATV